jgi:small GTP-binding protein
MPDKITADEFFKWLIEEEDDESRSKEVVLVKKVCMVGDPAVGKTSLIRRFVYDVFDDKYIETIGAKVTKKTMRIQYIPTGQTFQLRMMIWDIAGHGALDFVKPSYYRDAEGALIVCDVTRRSSLEMMNAWIDSLSNVTGPIPLVMIGNKFDLKDQAEFGEVDLSQLAGKYKAPYLFTSAKSGTHVEAGFRGLGLSLIQQFLRQKK